MFGEDVTLQRCVAEFAFMGAGFGEFPAAFFGKDFAIEMNIGGAENAHLCVGQITGGSGCVCRGWRGQQNQRCAGKYTGQRKIVYAHHSVKPPTGVYIRRRDAGR